MTVMSYHSVIIWEDSFLSHVLISLATQGLGYGCSWIVLGSCVLKVM